MWRQNFRYLALRVKPPHKLPVLHYLRQVNLRSTLTPNRDLLTFSLHENFLGHYAWHGISVLASVLCCCSGLKLYCNFTVGGLLPRLFMSPQGYLSIASLSSDGLCLSLDLLVIRAHPKEVLYLYSGHSHHMNVSNHIAGPKPCIMVIQNENILNFLLK